MVDVTPDYSLPQIHCMMLGDEERMSPYEDALNKTAKGKTVLDYGAGTGILSMMAARAGAKKVYAIEDLNADLAKRIIRHNRLEGKIEVIDKNIFDADIPKVDLIVSEWMGIWAVQENMLPGLLYARDNFLKKNGIILPNKINLYLVPSFEFLDDVPIFDNIHGFDLRDYLENVRSQPSVRSANTSNFISKPEKVYEMDMNFILNQDPSCIELSKDYLIEKDGEINCLYGWFDAEFYDLSRLDTSPKTKTHWQQARFLVERPVQVKKGDLVKIRMNTKLNDKDNQRIDFKAEISK